MPSIGVTELLVVLAVALLVIGPKKLPDLGRSVGRAIRELRRAGSTVQREMGLDEVADDVREIKQSAQKVTGNLNVGSHLGLDDIGPLNLEGKDAEAAETDDHSTSAAGAGPSAAPSGDAGAGPETEAR